MAVGFVLNGERVEVGDFDPHLTLLSWLRAAGHTGTKEGCAEGECGSCAVALLRRDGEGRTRFEPVNSCLLPLPSLHGRSVITVEGVGAGGLHPVQAAMVERGGSQCGYCTPGFVVSLFCEYYRPGRSGFDPESISGNLCRCTGYRPIAEVARELPAPAPGDPRLRLPAPPPASLDHRGAGRRFLRPLDLHGVVQALAAHPEATLIAGGTDLMVGANQRGDRFALLVSLEAVPELRELRLGPDELVIGAGLPLAELVERLPVPLFQQLLPLFSSRLIRNRATLGGNLATASPIGDSPPVLLALGAQLTLASARGTRRLALDQFFLDYRRTALGADEVIVSVHLPLPLPAVQRFYKVSKRVLDDISTVAAAFALDLSSDGKVRRLGLAYGGVAATPLRATAVEAMAVGRPWTRETLAVLREALAAVGTPMSDHRGSAAYRRAMIGSLLEKFFEETRP
jgi:xanthine dehydrogenase small subunit